MLLQHRIACLYRIVFDQLHLQIMGSCQHICHNRCLLVFVLVVVAVAVAVVAVVAVPQMFSKYYQHCNFLLVQLHKMICFH